MATLFELTLVGERESDLRSAGEAALDEIERLEEQLSLFLPTSDIAYINRHAADRRVEVERRLYRLLERASELSDRTDGAFDVAVGALMRAIGLRGESGLEPTSALTASGMRRVDLREGGVRLLDARTRLDLGAIGKGYAIDRALGVLARHGVRSAFLHGGWSTLYALGAPPDADGWTIGLVDPADETNRIGSVTLRDRALSVSGSEGRADLAGDDSGAAHVVDPRSGGEPARQLAWATAPSATDADALSTAFLLQDGESIETLCASSDYGAVLLDPSPRALGMEAEFFTEERGGGDLSRRGFLRATAAAAAGLLGRATQSLGSPDGGRRRDPPRSRRCRRAGSPPARPAGQNAGSPRPGGLRRHA